MSHHYFEFREPKSAAELRALLELRYRVYRESRLKHFAPENSLHLDLDSFDVNAMHFGLFRADEPVGYMRLVTDRREKFADDIITIASEDETVLRKILETPNVPFPVMTYAPNVENIQQLYTDLQKKGERLVEPGRFSLDESARGRHIAQLMVAATFAVTIANEIDSAILSCSVKHAWMYKYFGFSQFPDVTDFLCERIGASLLLLLLLGVGAGVTASERGKVMDMVEAYRSRGRICYNPAEPNNYFPPDEIPALNDSELRRAA